MGARFIGVSEILILRFPTWAEDEVFARRPGFSFEPSGLPVASPRKAPECSRMSARGLRTEWP